MKFLTNFILSLIGLLILVMIAFFGYQFYQKLNAPAVSPFNAIPSNSALIIKINKPTQFWNETKQSNRYWRDLFQIPALASIKQQVGFLDSTIHINKKISQALGNNPLFLILTPGIANSIDLLYLFNVNGTGTEELIEEYLNQNWPSRLIIEKTSYAGSNIFTIKSKTHKNKFFIAIRNKVFIGSTQNILVKQAIDRLSLNLSIPEDPEFLKVTSSSGKNVDANIFIHYPAIAPFLSNITTGGPLADYLSVANFASWSGLDFIQKQDTWLISGYSACKDSSAEYLSLFQGQSAQKISMTKIFPENVLSFTWIGLSDGNLFHEKLKQSLSKTSIYFPIDMNLVRIEQGREIAFSDYFLPWLGNEIGLITLQNPSKNDKISYGIFRVNNKSTADSLLLSLMMIGPKQKAPVIYKTHKIYSFLVPGVIPAVFGNLFSKLEASYYVFIDDYVIFSKDEISVKSFIDETQSGKSIEESTTYRNFSVGISDLANLYYYCNVNLSFSDIQSVLNDELNKEITLVKDSLQRFKAFGVQIINRDGDFYTNVYIHHNQSDQNQGPMVWQTPVDNAVATKPQIIPGGINGKPVIVAVDAGNILYLLDGTGVILWKLKLPGKPLGEIHPLTMKNPDSVYFIFNTQNQLFIVDQDGLFALNSPFTFPKRSVADLLIAGDPISGKESVLIPLEDNKIYAFGLDGIQKPGWQKPTPGTIVAKPVQRLNMKGKDFYFLSGIDGTVLITNSQGKPFRKPKNSVKFSRNSLFYVNKTNNKGDFITTTADGKLIYLRMDGTTSVVKFNNFTPDHILFYSDVNDDKLQEFTWFDVNKLYCYNKFKKLLYDFSLPPGTEKPFIVKFPDGDVQIGAVTPKTGDVFLFGKKGSVSLDPLIRGNTPYDVGVLDNELGVSLVIGSGNYIKNFLLTKY
jgi:hypothetical protein